MKKHILLNIRYLALAFASMLFTSQMNAQTSITHIYTDVPGTCWTLWNGDPSWGNGVETGCGNATVTVTNADFIHLDDAGIAHQLPMTSSCNVLFITPDNELNCFSTAEFAASDAIKKIACTAACVAGGSFGWEVCKVIPHPAARLACWGLVIVGGVTCEFGCDEIFNPTSASHVIGEVVDVARKSAGDCLETVIDVSNDSSVTPQSLLSDRVTITYGDLGMEQYQFLLKIVFFSDRNLDLPSLNRSTLLT